MNEWMSDLLQCCDCVLYEICWNDCSDHLFMTWTLISLFTSLKHTYRYDLMLNDFIKINKWSRVIKKKNIQVKIKVMLGERRGNKLRHEGKGVKTVYIKKKKKKKKKKLKSFD